MTSNSAAVTCAGVALHESWLMMGSVIGHDHHTPFFLYPREMNALAQPSISGAFATPEAGYDYFGSEAHYRSLAVRITAAFGASSIVLVTGEPRAYALILSHALGIGGKWRNIVVVSCRSVAKRREQLRTARALVAEGEQAIVKSGNLAPVLIILSEVDRLSEEDLLDIHKSCRLDDPRIALMLMLASPSFIPRLDGGQLGILKVGPSARFRFQHLGLDEVGSFILHQLSPGEREQVSKAAVAAVAKAAGGDPVVVNRLAAVMLSCIALNRDQDRQAARRASVLPSPSSKIVSAQVAETDSHVCPEQVAGGAVSESILDSGERGTRPAPDKGLSLTQPEDLASGENRGHDSQLADRNIRARPGQQDLPASYQSGTLPGEGVTRGPSLAGAQSDKGTDFSPINFFGDTSPRQVNLQLKGAGAQDIFVPKIEPANWLAASGGNSSAVEDGADNASKQTGPTLVTSSRQETRSRRGPGVLALLAVLGTSVASFYFLWGIYGNEIERAVRDSAREATNWGNSILRRNPVGEASVPPEREAPPASTDLAPSNLSPPHDDQLSDATVAPLDQKLTIGITPPEEPSAEQLAGLAQGPHATGPAETTDVNTPSRSQAPSITDTHQQAPAADVAAFVARGDRLFALHDVASARLLYERAAEAGDGAGALRLGMTFDPVFLRQAGFYGALGDSDKALSWYRRASELGDVDAKRLLGK